MKKLAITGVALLSAAAAFSAPRPAYDTGSTEFFYSKAQVGYSWTEHTDDQGQATPGFQTLNLQLSYPINELAFVTGGFQRGALKNTYSTYSTETIQQGWQIGGGARFPIAMDIDFNVGARYNWVNTQTNVIAGDFTYNDPDEGEQFASFYAGVLAVIPDTSVFAAANLELDLTEQTQSSVVAEVGLKPSDAFSISATGEFDTDFTQTTLGFAGNLHF